MPKIDAVGLPDLLCQEQLEERVAVVIDVLRASTTIGHALENGARCVVPVASVDGAKAIAHDRKSSLLCGERGGVRPQGFVLGNSPFEYNNERVGGKDCVFTTTNGTRALGMVDAAASVVVGSIRNIDAVCDWIRLSGRSVVIVCSGTDGQVSLEDCLCGGMFVDRLGYSASDGASMMYHAMKHAQEVFGSTRFAVESSFHAKRLIDLGFGHDVAFACETAKSSVVPIFDSGIGEIVAD